MYKQLLYIVFGVFLFLPVQSQDYNYVHYDTRDGLAGTTVYDQCQDKEGYMWFATENGLSRFDGTHFRNYTVKDGLPDNEVLKLFSDSKGRIWICPFSKDICYYYKGKIYNKYNDSLFKKLHFIVNVDNIVELPDGTLVFSEKSALTMLDINGSATKISSAEIFGHQTEMLIGLSLGLMNIMGKESWCYYTGGRSFTKVLPIIHRPQKIDDSTTQLSAGIMYKDHEVVKQVKFVGDLICGESANTPDFSYVTFYNTSNGVWQFDTASFSCKNHFLPGKTISHTLVDMEQNTWFSTLGEGVYRLPSSAIKTISPVLEKRLANKEVFSMAGDEKRVIAGFGYSKAVELEGNKVIKVHDFSEGMKKSWNAMQNNRLYAMKALEGGTVMMGFDGFLIKLENDREYYNYSFPIKSVEEVNKEVIIVGNASCAYTMRLSDLKILDTIWHGRTTKVFFNEGKYYIGTLNGIYEVNADKSHKYLGELNHALTRRIADIKLAADGNLWIATSDEGLVAYKNGVVKKLITDSNGLSSNICKSIFSGNKCLWVGTNKGLNKLSLEDPATPIIRYSMSDGLPSDVINAVYVKDSIVWVGTPVGITYFNEYDISGTSVCILKLQEISIAGKVQPEAAVYHLPYNTTNIRVNYTTISFKSGGEISYHYRMKGLNNEWLQTNQTVLDYQSLPPGNYELEIYAVNKFLKKSETLVIKFSIDKPFWQSWWFFAAVALGLVSVTIWLVNRRNKKVRDRLEENNMLQKQFAALEQQALQSQMNPHFIFNCLNSIQQYILTNDKEKANRYLTGFASLVRQTLDNSEKSSVTVGEEMEYLKQYLEMEKMRFGDTFVYSIETDDLVQKDFTELPALLLQPYVENSLRHGLRYRDDKSGMVNIRFNMQGETLICSIKDNGVGRKKAAAYKSQQHIEYQSKGMNLTRKRIDLLNKMNETNIEVEIKDLADEQGTATGTEVIVKIPV